MNIKDVVNRDIVNLQNCDQEPIHIPGSIQPHGFLVALKCSNLSIEYCSGNVLEFTGYEPAQLLGHNYELLAGKEQAAELEAYVRTITGTSTTPIGITIGERSYLCNVHKADELWVLEFEPTVKKQPAISQIYEQTIHFVKYMKESATLQELCLNVAEEIRELTGYDRVMVYRFDKDYNGEVYAESKRDDLESFLGLHYPHTDIPVQARQLYIRNLMRMIVDVSYTPVPVFTIDDSKEKNIDLSLSTLRSVSPIHIQYLQNMGVGATLTISLLLEGNLWGLVACHHYSPLYIDHFTRINAQLQGHFLTSQIRVREQAEEYAASRTINKELEQLLNTSFLPERSSLADIVTRKELLSICNATGVSILLDDKVYRSGITPTDEQIRKLSAWADKISNHNFYSTSELSADYQDGASICSSAAGILFYALKGQRDASIIWYSVETLQEVYWAGDPDKAIVKDASGLSPRKSFDKWKEIIKCKSREWAKPELSAATNYAYALQKHVTLLLLTEEDRKQKQLSEELQETNAELENINWISTHDMKEPLRKIRMFSSRLLSNKELPANICDTVTKMSDSAARMMKLIEDLTQYSSARITNEHFEKIDLHAELQNILNDLREEIAEKNAVITIGELPQVNGIPVLLQQLFLNLLRNALKFSKKDESPVISVSCVNGCEMPADIARGEQRFNRVAVTDNGIGFEKKFERTVFNVFTRLNGKMEYEGSGIGLALCRKIMKIHGGYIVAEGNPGKGAGFYLYFPDLDTGQ